MLKAESRKQKEGCTKPPKATPRPPQGYTKATPRTTPRLHQSHPKGRRHRAAPKARLLVLAAPGQWPNLASRVLKLACERLPQDWQEHFGCPAQVVETLIDPLGFRGTCYKTAGWQPLGPTQEFERSWQDFCPDTQHPKELWARPLGASALEESRAPDLPPALADPQHPWPPACQVATDQNGGGARAPNPELIR